jgi:hypothetical protein
MQVNTLPTSRRHRHVNETGSGSRGVRRSASFPKASSFDLGQSGLAEAGYCWWEMPLLGDLLEDALMQFGRSTEEFERLL